MSEKRKDKKGRVLRLGESQRDDGRYQYRYVDQYGKRKTVYSWRLVETDIVPNDKKHDLPLRDMEKKIQKDIDAGIAPMDRDITLNYLIPLNLSLRKLADSTKENYKYMYERFIKDSSISEISIVDLKKTHILRFYKQQSESGLADGTIQMLHKIIIPL